MENWKIRFKTNRTSKGEDVVYCHHYDYDDYFLTPRDANDKALCNIARTNIIEVEQQLKQTNVELAKKELQKAIDSLNSLNEKDLTYYNSFNNGDDYFNAGTIISMHLGHGVIKGILANWK